MRMKDSLHKICEGRMKTYDDLKGTGGTGGVGAFPRAPKFSSLYQKSPEYTFSDFLRKSSRSKLLSISFKENAENFLLVGNFGFFNETDPKMDSSDSSQIP
jgi:hypothetical protein